MGFSDNKYVIFMVVKMTNPNNPLRQHFRQPAIYAQLPSQGRYYPPGAINMPTNQELPILPMTAIDEITSRTPDALYNGSAIVEIISSCVPSIKDAWSVPSMDLNALLVAVRLASYGHKMEIGSVCPKCGHEHNFELDLRQVMDSFGKPDFETPLVMGDLTIKFAPLTYRQMSENNKFQFEDQKLMQAINEAELDDQERLKLLSDAFRKITTATLKSMASGIANIQTPNGVVVEQEYIIEFLENCEKAKFERVKEYSIKLKEASDFKPLDIKCVNCQNEYLQGFSLDMSNFFEANS